MSCTPQPGRLFLFLEQEFPYVSDPKGNFIGIEIFEKGKGIFARSVENVPEFSDGHLGFFAEADSDKRVFFYLDSVLLSGEF